LIEKIANWVLSQAKPAEKEMQNIFPWSEWVPSKMRGQTADKRIMIICNTPHNSNPSINVLQSEKVVCLQETNPSFILCSPVKKLSPLNQERQMHRSSTVDVRG